MLPLKTVSDIENYLLTVPRARTVLLKKEELSLKPIRVLLSGLGNPHFSYPVIFVWGTSGKGSTVTFIASILHAAGFKVGHLVSPHVEHIRERIQINLRWLSEKKFVRYGREVIAQSENLRHASKPIEPSFFEVITAMQFLAFAKEKVDIAVVEVGLGGEFDATNICPRKVSVLTSIDLEHCQVLGRTLSEIARNEAALIRANIPVITQENKDVPLKILQHTAKKRKSRLQIVSRESQWKIHSRSLRGTTFDLQTPKQSYANLNIVLPGDFQVLNAVTAVMAVEALPKSFTLSLQAIHKGLRQARIPGRFEVVSQYPLRVLDGAHNPAKVRALVRAWKNLSLKPPRILLAIKQSKDARRMIRALKHLSPEWIVTTLPDHGMIPVSRLRKIIRDEQPRAHIQMNESLPRAWAEVQETSRPVLVTGSLYLVAAVRELI